MFFSSYCIIQVVYMSHNSFTINQIWFDLKLHYALSNTIWYFYLHLAIHNLVLPKHVLHEWWIVRRLHTVLLKLPTKWPGFILGYWGQCCFVLWVIVIDWMFWKYMCLQAWWSCISPLICVETFWVIFIIS